MPIVLSNGYIKPESGDKGSSFFPQLEQNIQRVNDHNHDGVNSNKIPPSSLAFFSSDILNSNWGSPVNGVYSQVITVPGSIAEVNDYDVHFYNTSNGHRLLLSMERQTATTYRVYINDNSLNIKAIYR